MLKKRALIIIALFLFPFYFIEADSRDQLKTYFVDREYDVAKRDTLSSQLKVVSEHAYFYIESEWYDALGDDRKEAIDSKLLELKIEFDNLIYPKLTSFYGTEWIPGIDNDSHITVLFHELKDGVAGYFRNEDEYPLLQSSRSNEREIIYLNAEYLFSPLIKGYLAHEFTHLLNFNQKERLKGVMEEVWLNEARAEFAIDFLGYNDNYEQSNLQQRVRDFLSLPADPLIDWQNQKEDYGSINLFMQYLRDHYTTGVIADSMKSSKTGIASINESLEKWGVKKDFSDIFSEWIVSNLINDCQGTSTYCYKNDNLKTMKIIPSLIFLPSLYQTNVSLEYSIQPWSGNWYRIVGGDGDLLIDFQGKDNADYGMAFVACDNDNKCDVGFVDLINNKGEIAFIGFGLNYKSLTLIPYVTSGKADQSYSFSLDISLENKEKEQIFIQELQAQITLLQKQIQEIKNKISLILSNKIECGNFIENLYYGKSNQQVSCLQKLLIAEEVYPEGLITGYFGFLTRKAVISFQEKYMNEILLPLNLSKGTGYVGRLTRDKLNIIK